MRRLELPRVLAAVSLMGGSPAAASTFWNVFNIEGESAIGADIVTYGSLGDMVTNSNRTGTFTLNGAGTNIVGSGASISVGLPAVPLPASALLLASAFGAGAVGQRMRRLRESHVK